MPYGITSLQKHGKLPTQRTKVEFNGQKVGVLLFNHGRKQCSRVRPGVQCSGHVLATFVWKKPERGGIQPCPTCSAPTSFRFTPWSPSALQIKLGVWLNNLRIQPWAHLAVRPLVTAAVAMLLGREWAEKLWGKKHREAVRQLLVNVPALERFVREHQRLPEQREEVPDPLNEEDVVR